MEMVRLAAVILTYNEAHHIEACIASLRGCADVVVVWDSGSTDGTPARALAAGALVVQRPFDNYAAQRQAALAAEIAQVLEESKRSSQAPVGYWVPRRNLIVGHEMRGGGFYPDHQLRLLRRGAAHYVPDRHVHEIVELSGQDAYLRHPLIHFNYFSWEQFHRKQRFYAAYEARILAMRGIRPRPHNFVLQPLREFWRRFVTLSGWRDGWQGVRIAFWLAWYYGLMPYVILLRLRPEQTGYTTAGRMK